MKRPLKILFLASWYPNKTDSFLGNFVQRHAEAISTRHEVYVVSAFPYHQPSIERVQRGNLTEITVYYRNELPFLSYLWSMRKGIREAQRASSEFDICHVNVAWPAGIFALFLGIPFIVTEHFSGYLPARNHRWPFMSKTFTRKILRKAHCVVPVSEFLRDAIHKFAPEARFRIIPNVVNEKLFHYNPPKEGKFTFLHISTLEDKSKNIRGIMDAINKVAKKGHLKFKLIIGGDGNMNFLERVIRENSSGGPHVETISRKSPHEVARLMSEAHALLMFSHYETQSCTILEALCSGRPVVSSAVGGIPEITDETNSIMVEDNDRIGLARAIDKMIVSYDQFNNKKIAEQAGNKYSYATVAQSYDEVYASALKSGSSNH
jgi:glycosyltransferase involved in cell wall biosynthesis